MAATGSATGPVISTAGWPAHPGVTAVGVAWSVARIPPGEFVPEPHDLPMMAVVTDLGIVG